MVQNKGEINMSNKSLEALEHWVDNQRMSFERKYELKELIRNAVKEAEDDVRREMKQEIENMEYEHREEIKEMNTPSNAFVSVLKQTLEEHPEIVLDLVKEGIESFVTISTEDHHSHSLEWG